MQNLTIINLDAKTLGGADLSELKSYGNYIEYPTTTYQQTFERAKQADIILTNKVVLDKPILESLPNLKLICVTATGTNIIDIDYAKSRGIKVKNVAGYSTLSVAQHTLTLALDFLSQIHYYDSYVKSGAWCKSDIFTHLGIGRAGLAGKKWGIIGFGSIGQRVAHLAKAFDAQVCYTSTSGKNDNPNAKRVELDELLRECDIISIHAPLNPATKNLIDSSKLELLKSGAILLNLGRGGIVSEEAVAKALKNGADFYYGTDVLESEPMRENHPFLDSALISGGELSHRLLITPHIAWAYGDSLKELVALSIKNVIDFVKNGE